MRRWASDYAAAAAFLVLFAIGGLVTALLSPGESAALRLWASTNVESLQHHPVPALALSAFLPSGSPFAWLATIALTMFGANRAAGTARLALTCAAGHLIGTGVSEGIVAYRVGHGSLPPSWSHIPDVGPSYVVVSAIVVAVMFGSWLTRVTVLAVFAVLVFVSHIFAGLASLQVAAVGHLTAIVTAAALGLVFGRQVARRAGGTGRDDAGWWPRRSARGRTARAAREPAGGGRGARAQPRAWPRQLLKESPALRRRAAPPRRQTPSAPAAVTRATLIILMPGVRRRTGSGRETDTTGGTIIGEMPAREREERGERKRGEARADAEHRRAPHARRPHAGPAPRRLTWPRARAAR